MANLLGHKADNNCPCCRDYGHSTPDLQRAKRAMRRRDKQTLNNTSKDQ